MKKYGVKNNFERVDMIQKSNIEKYGVPYANMLEENKLKGENNPAYNGNIKKVDYRTNSKYRNFLKYAFERDNYTCQKCGNKGYGRKLNVHHIYDRSHYPELTFVPENSITLCSECHKDFHRIHNARLEENNLEQIQEFLGRNNLIL